MVDNSHKNGLIKWMVLLGDIIAYFCIMHLVVWLFPAYVPAAAIAHVNIVALMGMLCVALYSFAIPTVIHKRRVDMKDIFTRNALVAFLSQTTFAVIWHLITINSTQEINFLYIMLVAIFFGFVGLRIMERWLLGFMRSRGRNTRSVVFVGNDPANLAVYRDIISDPATGYIVQGYYSNGVMEDAPPTFKKLGSRQDLQDIISGKIQEKPNIDDLFCSLSHNDHDEISHIMRYCDKEIIRFYYVPRIFQNLQMSLKPEMLGDTVVFTSYHEPMMMASNRIIKRIFDIVFSFLVLLFLIPFVPIIWLIIRTQSPGPLFFRQERTGMNGRNFTCYKFRSMHVNSDADRVQATKNDPRKFAFGDFMRKSNIDELPQFFNVLKGDMSVVGPRPHMTLHTEQYSALIEKYMIRHFAKPGITGWAQVTGFRGETEELWQMEGRILKDIWYIENWTLWLDIKICFMTAFTIFIHDKNAY